MTDKFQALAKQYPRLFPDPEAWTIECHHEGWYKVIDDAMDLIDGELQCMPEELVAGIQVHQIKSKFGSLRIYLSQTTPYIRGCLSMAERCSSHICEICGNEGSLRSIQSWMATLCYVHYPIELARVDKEAINQTK